MRLTELQVHTALHIEHKVGLFTAYYLLDVLHLRDLLIVASIPRALPADERGIVPAVDFADVVDHGKQVVDGLVVFTHVHVCKASLLPDAVCVLVLLVLVGVVVTVVVVVVVIVCLVGFFQ